MATVATVNNVPWASGLGYQSHLFYAVNSARWWCLYEDSTATTSLKSAYSSDLTTWTAGATLTITNAHNNEGRNFAVAYKNIASTDVVHVGVWTQVSATSKPTDHVRGTISGTTLTWGTMAQIETDTNNFTMARAPVGVVFDSGNTVIQAGEGFGDFHVLRSSNTDAGTSWTAGFGAQVTPYGANAEYETGVLFDLGSTNLLAITDDASTGSSGAYTFVNLFWSKYTGTWSASANVRGTSITAASKADWGAVARTTSDVHLVLRNGTQLEQYRFNGTSWSTVTNLPAQTSKAGSGVFLASDGTDVWCFVIDSGAANAITYCKWSSGGATWGSWTTLVSSTATRTGISGYPTKVAGGIGVLWTEGSASPYSLVVANLTFGVANSVTLSVVATGTATLKRAVGKPLAATATGTASLRRAAAKALTATVTGTATLRKGAARALAATATGTATLGKGVGKGLAVVATGTATLGKGVGKGLAVVATGLAALASAGGTLLTRGRVLIADLRRNAVALRDARRGGGVAGDAPRGAVTNTES